MKAERAINLYNDAPGRFDRLAGAMIDKTDDEHGWIELPKKEVAIGGEILPVGFFVFWPEPIEGYATSYHPSIMMEIGEPKRGENPKELVGLTQVFVRQDFLNQSNGNQSRYDKALDDLGNIEEVFLAYDILDKFQHPN